MKIKPSARRSSVAVSLPVLIGSLIGCALAAFFGKTQLALSLMAVFLIPFLARMWACACAKGLSFGIMPDCDGVFPGDSVKLRLRIENKKFLPALWLELFGPLPEKLCLMPDETVKPDMWDLPVLEQLSANREELCLVRLKSVMWYETKTAEICLNARRRGIFRADNWLLRTGDGFGLAVTETLPEKSGELCVAVYPQLVPVSADVFMKNMWNCETGAKGLTPDETVIRSTRDYFPGDNAKSINWRLLARGLPMCVNVYDEILPQRVHFIFDGESFNIPGSDGSELEEALSILASELVLLSEKGIPCALSICAGNGAGAVDITSDSLNGLLYALAAYEPLPLKKNDSGELAANETRFSDELFSSLSGKHGRCFYICRREASALKYALSDDITVISYDSSERSDLLLSSLREGAG